jgi:PAS domain S-box-containing protein
VLNSAGKSNGGANRARVSPARTARVQPQREAQLARVQRAKDAALAKLAEYAELFDHAPVGYLVLDRAGSIRRFNAAGARFLAVERSRLLGRKLQSFVQPVDRRTFINFLGGVFSTRSRQACEIRLRQPGPPRDVRLEAQAAASGEQCRMVLADITDRRQAEEALRESTQFSQEVVRGAPGGLIVYDRNLRYQVWNPFMEQISGMSAEQVVGRHPLDVFPFIRQTGLIERAERALRGETLEPYEFLVDSPPTGASGWLSEIMSPLRNANGQIVGVIATVRDVTDRKRMEDALRESSQFNQEVIRSAQEGVIVYGPDLRYRVWNPFMERLSGLSAEQVLGRHPLELFPFLRATGVFARLERALAGETLETCDFAYEVPSTGQTGWAANTMGPLRNAQGQVVGVIAMVHDVTERKRAEDTIRQLNEDLERRVAQRTRQLHATVEELRREIADRQRAEDALRRSETKFAKLFHASPAAMSLSRMCDGLILDVNEAFEKIFGCRRDEVIGRRSTEAGFWGDPQDRAAIMAELATKGAVSNDSIRWRHRDGRTIFARCTADIMEIDGEPCVLGVLMDITASRQAEEKLQQMRAQLAHVSRLSTMGEMLAEVVHELGQPLYAILNYARACRNVLAADAPLDRETLRQWCNKIAQIAADAGSIGKRFMTFAHRADSARTRCAVNEIVDESLALVEFDLQRAGVHVDKSLAPRNPAIQADRIQIQQVLVNLLRNAAEALDRTGARERHIRVQTAVVAEGAEITVTDNGSGLPDGGALHVFEPFVTTKPGGLGMGLAVSLAIVRGHQGRLWAENNAEKGACFHCVLPLA